MDKKNPQIPEIKKKVDNFIYEEIIKLNGSISAEHGIGEIKKEKLKLQLQEESLQKIRELKKIFDPDNILNPGKTII